MNNSVFGFESTHLWQRHMPRTTWVPALRPPSTLRSLANAANSLRGTAPL